MTSSGLLVTKYNVTCAHTHTGICRNCYEKALEIQREKDAKICLDIGNRIEYRRRCLAVGYISGCGDCADAIRKNCADHTSATKDGF